MDRARLSGIDARVAITRLCGRLVSGHSGSGVARPFAGHVLDLSIGVQRPPVLCSLVRYLPTHFPIVH